MIVKMKKVSIVVLDSTRKDSLKALRKMGLVHLETLEGKGIELARFKENSQSADKALSILDEAKLPKKTKIQEKKLTYQEARDKALEIVAESEKKKNCLDFINQNIQELERVNLWGEINIDDLKSLSEKGLYLYLYEIPQEKYSLIGENVKTLLVNTYAKTCRFLLVSDEELSDRPSALPPEAYEVPLPRASTEQIKSEIEAAEKEIAFIDKKIVESKIYSSSIREYKKELESDIEFENVYTGMGYEGKEENSQESSVKQSEEGSSSLAWISGYVPLDSYEDFKKFCKANSWAYAAEDASEEDLGVPTKLKNNKLVSLIYPLTDFLDVTPGYSEFDISGWFLLFFCIFFGMIFGDGGYGALITLASIFFIFKNLFTGKKVPPVFGLMLMLGLCTTVYGAMTCSWFGIETEKLPSELVDISFAPFSKAKVGEDAANTNQKIFCFILALIQLSIAHIKCSIKNRKSLKALGDIGALMELWGMFYIVMSLVVDSVKYPLGITEETLYVGGAYGLYIFPLPYVSIGVLLIGFILNFVFSNYEGSIGKSVLESCKNIISVLLGVVNVFSDIVSYIRLWAVALAGAAISGTVNGMAVQIFGEGGSVIAKMIIFALLAAVLLLFGHGLNNILNLLSVIVHGVRLNTLEFSQHLGMSWSGTKYRPFSEKK